MDVEDYDAEADIAKARSISHIILVTVRVDDLHLEDIISTVQQARWLHPDWPIIIAQTSLHNCYSRDDRHIIPYPFDGTDADLEHVDTPGALRRAMKAQRMFFSALPGTGSIYFAPIDFTQPSQGLPPGDYGADFLLDILQGELPRTIQRIRDNRQLALDNAVRRSVIVPWAFAAAAANAVPVPLLGGLGSASLQAAMVRNIAQRYGTNGGLDEWREFIAAMGTGFALGFGGGWLAQQVLKLGLGLGTALVAAWTFAVTWGIGEAALYFFRERSAGREADSDEMYLHYSNAFREAREYYSRSTQNDTASK